MSKLLKNPNFNNIGEFWAIGETVEETAKCLGITEEEVREVFDYHEAALMDYFEPKFTHKDEDNEKLLSEYFDKHFQIKD